MSRALSRVPVATTVLFYPGNALRGQIVAWDRGRHACVFRPSFARSMSGIRKVLERANLVLVDATKDYGRAKAAFTQAVARRGADGVAVYTETMHEGLELGVRSCGALLLLGPLSRAQWQGFFQRKLGLAGFRLAAAPPARRRDTKRGRSPRKGFLQSAEKRQTGRQLRRGSEMRAK